MHTQVLLENIGELVTSDENGHLHIISNTWLLLENNKIKEVGKTDEPPPTFDKPIRKIDAEKKLVTPGFIDSHTHPIFAGDRSNEFMEKLSGKTYQEIAQAGGGIKKTVRETRNASSETLLKLAKERLQKFSEKGVTTVEVKSGYGLLWQEELRHLEVIAELKKNSPLHIVPTCLALHDFPLEGSVEEYIKDCCEKLLPEVARQGLAEYVDIFIETGYYKKDQAIPYFEKAQELGLGIRVHAEEFSWAGGAEIAAKYQAKSADHLQFITQKDADLMAKNDVTATLLPGTSLYSNIAFTSVDILRQAGTRISVASDFNPGSCAIYNLPMLAILSIMKNKLTPAEAFAGITYNAAYSLGLQKKKGLIKKGYDADLLLHPFKSFAQWLADFGQGSPEIVTRL